MYRVIHDSMTKARLEIARAIPGRKLSKKEKEKHTKKNR